MFFNLNKTPISQRVKLLMEIWKDRMGYPLNLINPQTFGEKMQLYKLYYDNPEIPQIVDKVTFKDWVKDRLPEGEKYIAKLIHVWNSPEEVDLSIIPNKCVIKSNARDNAKWIEVITDKSSANLEDLEEEIKSNWFDEQQTLVNSFCKGYHTIRPKVFVEEYLEGLAGVPTEYKFFCFDGEPKVVYVSRDHFDTKDGQSEHKLYYPLSFYEMEWTRIYTTVGEFPPYLNAPKSKYHDEMVSIAQKLSKGFPFVRVDFFDTPNGIYLAELTFYPGGGFSKYSDENFNFRLGKYFKLPKFSAKERIDKGSKIYVVCGGISSEREVSLKSGESIFQALKKLGYINATKFDLNTYNISELLNQRPDLCFLALHGKGGEDGTIQGALELAGIPYTGSGVASSAICMDKVLTKQVAEAANIPTPKFLVFRGEDAIPQVKETITEKFGFPVVLKSPCQGSSIGVVIVHKPEDLNSAVEEIFKYGDVLMAEEFIQGTEISLPLLDTATLEALPIIEITSEREFYDYISKYTKGLCHHIIPANISKENEVKVIEFGKKAFVELGCKGLARIDFIITEDRGPMLIEVNTLPGMTEMSLFPDAARYAGISYEELVEHILMSAI